MSTGDFELICTAAQIDIQRTNGTVSNTRTDSRPNNCRGGQQAIGVSC